MMKHQLFYSIYNIYILAIITIYLLKMFKYTESNTVFDELYGTDKTISSQVANNFNLSKEL
jgi:hypothetical protein